MRRLPTSTFNRCPFLVFLPVPFPPPCTCPSLKGSQCGSRRRKRQVEPMTRFTGPDDHRTFGTLWYSTLQTDKKQRSTLMSVGYPLYRSILVLTLLLSTQVPLTKDKDLLLSLRKRTRIVTPVHPKDGHLVKELIFYETPVIARTEYTMVGKTHKGHETYINSQRGFR